MPSSLDTIAHIVLPNLMKLKGASTLVGAMERRDASPFTQVFTQTGIDHTPQLIAKERDAWRVGVMSMPTPSEMGEAYLCAFIAKKNDPGVTRYFTLEYDYVLATKTAKTIVCERDDRQGQRPVKRADGPAWSGDFQTDATAFVDAIMQVLEPST